MMTVRLSKISKKPGNHLQSLSSKLHVQENYDISVSPIFILSVT